ncbi:MAG: MFS transporter [Alphaproteobacteria bacterium]|nr:MFS transporter [Alphaproteobacteria bacterium]
MPTLKARPCDEAAIRATGSAGCPEIAKPWVLAVTILASTLSYIDESVVNVALPTIEGDLHASAAVVQWLVNAYMLSLTALVLVGGAAGDQFGRRKIFIAGTAIFAAASLWCGLAPDIAQLMVARIVQGAGAALLIPCSLAIIGATFDESERGRAIGTWAAFSAIAAAFGPVLGGFIVDHASWRWIFLINPFVALPTILIALRHVPESRDPQAPSGLDWGGAALALAGLGALVYGLIEAPERGLADLRVSAALLAGVLLLIGFLALERRSRAPMMPLALFRSRAFAGVNLLTLSLYAALGGAFFLLPFLLIQVHGFSATLAGAMFLPFTAIMAGLSRAAGSLVDRFGARLALVVGPTIAACGFAALALTPPESSYLGLLPAMVVLGLGMVVTVAPLTTTVINAVPERQAGIASGINNAVASLASLLAIAILGAVALNVHDRAIERAIAAPALSAQARQAVAQARGKFAADIALQGEDQGEDQKTAQAIVRQSLHAGIDLAFWLAAALALLAALTAAMTIPPTERKAQTTTAPAAG